MWITKRIREKKEEKREKEEKELAYLI